MLKKKPRLCIVAHNAYRALTGRGMGHIGGIERQTAIMSSWLAKQGWDVSVLVWSPSGDSVETAGGVRLIGICPPNSGVRGIRFFHPRMTALIHAMDKADADIYYHNTAEYVTGVIASWAHRRRKKFVFSCASDSDVNPALPSIPQRLSKYLYRRGLRLADRIFVQTARQQRALETGFGLPGKVLPMPCPLATSRDAKPDRPTGRPRAAWIGRLDPVKRFGLLLEVAEKLPEMTFDVAAANTSGAEYESRVGTLRELHSRALKMNNINWLGAVPHDRIGEVYRNAHFLCCTSKYEGFPNTFLEAWGHGRPVVSSFDPDNLIQSRGLGAYATTAGEFVAALRSLADPGGAWHETSLRCRDYFFTTHAIDVAMPRFEQEFRDMLATGRDTREILINA